MRNAMATAFASCFRIFPLEDHTGYGLCERGKFLQKINKNWNFYGSGVDFDVPN